MRSNDYLRKYFVCRRFEPPVDAAAQSFLEGIINIWLSKHERRVIALTNFSRWLLIEPIERYFAAETESKSKTKIEIGIEIDPTSFSLILSECVTISTRSRLHRPDRSPSRKLPRWTPKSRKKALLEWIVCLSISGVGTRIFATQIRMRIRMSRDRDWEIRIKIKIRNLATQT